MCAIRVEVISEIFKLGLQISSRPKERVVQTLTTYRTDQSFDKRMRHRHTWHRFDFYDFEYAKVRLPPMESIHRIVVSAEVFWVIFPADRLEKHTAQRRPIHNAPVNTKPDNAPRELVHDHQNPMGLQCQRFKTKQVGTPQTVLRMS